VNLKACKTAPVLSLALFAVTLEASDAMLIIEEAHLTDYWTRVKN